MKKNARKLRLLSRKIDLGMFRSITINSDSITFWGNYSPAIVSALMKSKFYSGFTDSGTMYFYRSNILIFMS